MKLIAQTGPCAGQEFPLTKSVISIGRAAGNDVAIRDMRLSRQHAQIRQQAQEWVIVDLGSTNGTYVNDKRITGPQVVRSGDRIMLGETTLIVQDYPEVERAGAEAPTAPRVLARPAPAAPRATSSLPIIVAGGATVLFIAIIISHGHYHGHHDQSGDGDAEERCLSSFLCHYGWRTLPAGHHLDATGDRRDPSRRARNSHLLGFY